MRRKSITVVARVHDAEHDYLQKGHAFLNGSRYVEALAAYQQAHEMNPANAAILLWKARALTHLQRPYDALVVLEHALQLNPTLASAYWEQSVIFMQLGKPEEARMAAEHALAPIASKDDPLPLKRRALHRNLVTGADTSTRTY
jgi:Cytochrome c biogenesis factor